MLKEKVEQNMGVVISQFTEVSKAALWQVAALVSGFLTSRTAVFGDYAPFGLALSAGVPSNLSIAAALGSAVGYLIPATGQNAFRYIAAVFAIAAVKLLLPLNIKLTKTPAFSAFLALAACLVTGFAMAVIGPAQPLQMIMFTAEGLLAGGSAYFIHKAVQLPYTKRGARSLTHQELASAVITMSILLMALTPISIGGVSIARVAAVIFVLSAARYGHEQAGAIAGIAAGFAMSLTGSGLLYVSGSYALGGLIAGIFSPLGSVGCAVVFIISNGIISIQAGGSPAVISGLYEVFAATVIFLVIPRKIGVKLSEFFSPTPEMPRLDGLRKAVGVRLEFASNALSDVSATVEDVAQKLKRISAPAFEDIFNRVELETCAHCGLKVHCWENERAQTLSCMVDMTKIIRTAGTTMPENVGGELSGRCSRLPELYQSLRTNFLDYTAKRAAQQRVDEVRSVVSDQFQGVSDMLYEMALDFEKSQRYDISCAERVDAALKNLGIIASDIGCSIDKFERMTVEIRTQEIDKNRINKIEVMNELSAVCERDFDAPCITEAGRGALITLTERAAFSVEYGVEQYSCGKARMCGDAYEYFNDGKGRSIMILSDGMGTGGRAAVDGAMASGLMSRLIKAGFGFDCSLRIVNSAMLFKSTDESLATMDVTCIDLFTGRADLYKAGACPTMIRRNGRTGKAECASLPAGILREIGFDCAGITLGKGDIVLMVSDGAISEGTDWICAELESWGNGTAQQLAEHIAGGTRRRRSDGHEDDITVMAAIIGRNY